MHGTIPPEARRFLVDHIASVAQLEMLLLMRSSPDIAWTADDLSRELRVDRAWALDQFRFLRHLGLLTEAEGEGSRHRYAPRNAELAQTVEAIARAYLLNRVTVIELIYSQSTEKIRAFAEAFRLRKEQNDG